VMLLCGLAPAMESTRVDLVSGLKGKPAQFAKRRFTRRNLRLTAQVAGSMVQLVIASLFLRTIGQVVHLNPGFDADRILTAEITLDGNRFNQARGLNYVDEAIQRVGVLPGVEAASMAVRAPLSWLSASAEIEMEGQPAVRAQQVMLNCVTPGYFRTMGIARLRGRDFELSDRAGAPRVAIVGEAFAKRFFPDGEVVGKRLRVDGQVHEIVGVVRDSNYSTLGEAPQPLLYQPFAQDYGMGAVLHVRVAGPPAGLAAAVKRELAAIEKGVPVSITPMRDIVEQSLVSVRNCAVMLGIMGGLGMLLAITGLYGLVSYSVSRRTSEIGIRMALGASPQRLLRGVLKEGLVMVGSGVAVGLMLALVLMQPLSRFLAGVKTYDPLSLLGPAALLIAAGLGASYVPARRATRVDPMTALRCE
jgi:predicted permease